MYYHQIYFVFDTTTNVLPTEYEIIKSYINENCSNLKYKLWTYAEAVNFIKESYPIFYNFFVSDIKFPIIKCDLFRYLLMYHFGGIYTDLDFICIKPFNKLLQMLKDDMNTPSIILSEEWLESMKLTQTIHNGILLSLRIKHPFWLSLVYEIFNDIIFNRIELIDKNDVFVVSGTKKLCTFYNTNKYFYNDICVLPYHYFCPYIAIENGEQIHYNNERVLEHKHTKNIRWVFYNIKEHLKLKQWCPNSFFVCVFLNTGSMWK